MSKYSEKKELRRLEALEEALRRAEMRSKAPQSPPEPSEERKMIKRLTEELKGLRKRLSAVEKSNYKLRKRARAAEASLVGTKTFAEMVLKQLNERKSK